MRSKLGITILILGIIVGPVHADQCEVVITIPITSAGAVLTLDASLVPVEEYADVDRLLYFNESVEAGETLCIVVCDSSGVDGPSRELDYIVECDLKVTYPSGNTALVEFVCDLAGEWVGEPGCECSWIED